MKIKMPNGDNFAYIGPFGMAQYMENCCDEMREEEYSVSRGHGKSININISINKN